MARKTIPRSRKKAPAKSAVPKPASSPKRSSKKASKKKAPSKQAGRKKVPGAKARKQYPPGKSKQVPYDLVYVADSDIHGKGMFALKPIGKDVSLGLLEGKATTKDGDYVLWLTAKKGLRVTNDFRFINHSSKPNCALTGTDVVTLKKIKPDEELTHDYGW